MKTAKQVLSCVILASLAACSQNGERQTASAGRNNGERQEFGSATDIQSASSPNQPTNPLNAADNGHGGPASRESGNYQNQPMPGQNQDQELAKQIKVALTTGSMGTTGALADNQLTPIDVSVRNGVVSLTGPVSSAKERDIILKQVKGFKGVHSVEDHLQIGARNVDNKPLQPLVPRDPSNH
jgi:hypothetical protein